MCACVHMEHAGSVAQLPGLGMAGRAGKRERKHERAPDLRGHPGVSQHPGGLHNGLLEQRDLAAQHWRVGGASVRTGFPSSGILLHGQYGREEVVRQEGECRVPCKGRPSPGQRTSTPTEKARPSPPTHTTR